MTQNSDHVRRFIHRHPGPFDSDSPQVCLRKAWRAAGADREMALSVFVAELKAAGYAPKCVRNARGKHPPLYRLALPGPDTIGVMQHD